MQLTSMFSRPRVAFSAALAVLSMAVLAPHAAAETTAVSGGSVTSSSRPEIGNKLLSDGMLPLAVGGARISSLSIVPVVEELTFEVTGGSVNPQALFTGELQTSGGIKFPRLWCLCSVTVSDLRIMIGADPHVIATVNGDPTQQIRLFDMDLMEIGLDGQAGDISFTNVHLKMADQGAQVLNAALNTDVFVPGEVFAGATTNIKYDV